MGIEGSRAGGEGRGVTGLGRVMGVLVSQAEESELDPEGREMQESFEQRVVCLEAGSRKITLWAGRKC